MQYAAVDEFTGDANALKATIADEVFRHARLPADPNGIHAILARCHVPLYVTTNYDGFIFEALERQGKRPYWNLSPWYYADDEERGRPELPEEDPSPNRPLVFHLHGHYLIPHSMVLTEDDYIDYLVELIGQSPLRNATDDHSAIIPRYVRMQLRRTPLLFLGYGLQDHTFWTLFRTLLRNLPEGQRSKHVSLQLDPTGANADRVRSYLDKRLGAHKIKIFWMGLEEFTERLSTRLGEIP